VEFPGFREDSDHIFTDLNCLSIHVLADLAEVASKQARVIWWHISTVADDDEPARRAVSRQTCCKQRWTLSVINLRPVDNDCDGRRFRIIANFCRKLPILINHTCIWRLRWGWLRLSFVQIFGIRKTNSPWAIVCRCLCDHTFSCFSRTPTYDRQIDTWLRHITRKHGFAR